MRALILEVFNFLTRPYVENGVGGSLLKGNLFGNG